MNDPKESSWEAFLSHWLSKTVNWMLYTNTYLKCNHVNVTVQLYNIHLLYDDKLQSIYWNSYFQIFFSFS